MRTMSPAAHRTADRFTARMFRGLWVPAMLSSLGWALSDMADAVVVGQRLGAVGLAAIGLILPVYMINCMFAHGLGLGGSVRYSRLLSQGKTQEAADSFHGVLALALLFSVTTAVLGSVFIDPLLALLEDYNKGDLEKQVPPAQSGPQPGKAGRDRPIVIMLDPGHGGEDSGAVGKYKTREKDVVLQIARRLRSLIEKEGNMKVYMTRNEDIFIPLQVRVAKAQKQRADLFVSIHADAFTSRQPSGSSVFALSTKGATSTAAKYLAQTQNASDLIGGVSKSGDRYVDHTMFDMVQSLTIADSLKFGKAVLNKLGKINKLHKNQVEQAGFAVLKAPDIPSILVETAFISNVEEERKLKTATFQQEVAESILAGIKAYFADGATLARRG